MRWGLASLAVLALAACAHAPETTAPAPVQARASDVVDSAGYGPVAIGMTIAEANAALGQSLIGDEPLDSAETCQTWHLGDSVEAPIYYMAQQGRITRVTLTEGAPAAHTPEGVGLGSTDAQVRAAYPAAIEQPAPYGEPPAHDLIVWTTPETRGLRFEIDEAGRVTDLHAGDQSILLIEGCA